MPGRLSLRLTVGSSPGLRAVIRGVGRVDGAGLSSTEAGTERFERAVEV